MTLDNIKHILLVDDDELIRSFIKEVLTHHHFKVTEAENGKDGLKLFRSIHPDMVITDIVMPKMEGISFIQELRSYNKNISIIAMTGNIHGRMEEYLDISSKLGADYILRKPIKSEDLLATIDKITGNNAMI